jgi:hypothetical protein
MKILFIALILLLAVTDDLLTGKWETKPSEKGNITGVVFKNDSILEGYINRKPFVSGIYHFNAADSVLSFTDNGCNGVKCIYKVIFFSGRDSLRFRAIYDSCDERREGMQRLIMGRVTVKRN